MPLYCQSGGGRRLSGMDPMTKSLFEDKPLTDTERRYLAAASEGDLDTIKLCQEENGGFNVNCVDFLGRTALQLAVINDHKSVVQYLLDRCALDIIEDALMHAIRHSNVHICEVILNHNIYCNKKTRLKLEFAHEAYDQEENNPYFPSDLKPVVLAAHCNNFDIVNMMMQRGFYIETPHDFFCTCTECVNRKRYDPVVYSRSRLNSFRGLASTAYMSLFSDDPILTAFKLSRLLHHLAEKEKQYKNEYSELSEKCKNYAVELFNLCRTHEEVMAALHGESEINDLSRIKLAIKYDQKQFIAHASCQEHLQSLWYGDFPWFRHQTLLTKAIVLPLLALAVPLMTVIYLIAPKSRVGRFIRVPLIKFLNHGIAYLLFLVLLFIAASSKDKESMALFEGNIGFVNAVILLYVFGMFWAECKQLWEEGLKEYLEQLWNIMDIAMIALYTASYTVKFVISRRFGDLSGKDIGPYIVSNILFSMANVLSFARIAYLLPASETFGQLQIWYGRMLQDVFKFLFIYLFVMMAFVCGLTSLYRTRPEENSSFSNPLFAFSSLYWATFGMGDSEAPKLVQQQGHQKTTEEIITETVGYLMFAVFLLGAVVVLINMLIAMMSNTFEEIQDDEDVEWKFARATLWVSYFQEGATLPVPFNIIPTPKTVIRVFKAIKRELWKCGGSDTATDETDDTASTPAHGVRNHYAIMRKVVFRYIHRVKFGTMGEVKGEGAQNKYEESLKKLYDTQKIMDRKLNFISEGIFAIMTHFSSLQKRILRGADNGAVDCRFRAKQYPTTSQRKL